jgi:Spy/CpxP family protein refolding chaperone
MEGRQERNNGQREDQNVSGNRQNGTQNGEGQRGGIGRGLRGLNLSDEQKQQIRDIQRTARENGTNPQEVREQIRGVLTPEQAAKLEKRREKNRQKRENNQNPSSTGGGGSNP